MVTGVNKYYKGRKADLWSWREQSNLPFCKYLRHSQASKSTVKAFAKPVPCISKKKGKKYYTKFTMVLPLRSLSFPMSFRNTRFRSHIVLPQRISVSRHHSPVFWSKCSTQNVKPHGNSASDCWVGVLVCFRSPSVTITSGKYGR